jgi:hypothetical protein
VALLLDIVSYRTPSEICCGYSVTETGRNTTLSWLGEPLEVGLLQYQGLPSVPVGSPLIGSLRGLRAEVDEKGNVYKDMS